MAAHKILMSISSSQASYPMYPGSEGEERWPGYEAIQVHEITETKFNDTSHDRLYYSVDLFAQELLQK